MTESFRRDSEYDSAPGHGYRTGYPQQQPVSAPVNANWPPPPAHAPAPPSGSGRRARRPVAIVAAVAVVAAVAGGGAAYGLQELTGGRTAVSSAPTGSTAVGAVPSSAKGTVAGVVARVNPSVVEIKATSDAGESIGSGVIVTGGGQVVTNNHVIAGASSIRVTTSDGKSYAAHVVGTDSKKDLALVELRGASGLKAATLGDSGDLRVGDQVVAIGSPEGLSDTVTSGIVSALGRDVSVPTDENQGQGQGNGLWPFWFGGQEFNGDTGSSTTTYKAIQTDASLNPGNSGGALINMNGDVIGINSAMYSSSSDQSSSSSGSVGLGFAIPVNTVKADLAKLRAGSQS
ncbi:S1C family serine protease [Streptomyces sp. NPDC001544]|uniref:S1C family serine protease n=1 Tax=Streptomyces sp. NPDC001544 TaxID=3364584 RepID=UPI0036841C82